MKLEKEVTCQMYGQGITPAMIILGIVITAGIAAVFKIISSSRGKVKFFDFTLQWGN